MPSTIRMIAVASALALSLSVAPVLAQQDKKPAETKSAFQAKPGQPAQNLLNAALKQAKASKKRIFVLFDASW